MGSKFEFIRSVGSDGSRALLGSWPPSLKASAPEVEFNELAAV